MKGIQVYSDEASCPFPWGDNDNIAKKNIDEIIKKSFFSRTTWPISTKLGTKHLWVMWTHFLSNEVPHLFSRGDDNEIAKIHGQNLKMFFYRTAGLILTKIGTMHHLVTGIKVCSNKGPSPLQRADDYEIA